MNISLNNNYCLRQGSSCSWLVSKISLTNEIAFAIAIHPIHAIILSFFQGDDYMKSVQKASNYLNVSQIQILNFTNKLINNPNKILFRSKGVKVYFPKNTLIECCEKRKEQYTPELFSNAVNEMKVDRPQIPFNLQLLLTMNCKTNCIYCFADKDHNYKHLNINRVISLIQEAKDIGVVNLQISGGDIFAHPHWLRIISKVYECGFSPYLSTKIPLTSHSIEQIKEIGVDSIQISLDSFITKSLHKVIARNSDYIDKMKKTLRALNEFDIKIRFQSVITSKNSNIEDVQSIYEEIKHLENVESWSLRPALYSSTSNYADYITYKPQKKQLEIISGYLNNLTPTFDIKYSELLEEKGIKKYSTTDDFAKKAHKCGANFHTMSIMPDGKVGICEMLYWKQPFTLGSITETSIKTIWNSNSSQRLLKLSQENIQKGSACRTCESFVECRLKSMSVCYRDVISCYGDDNWDYPDPTCPASPMFNRSRIM